MDYLVYLFVRVFFLVLSLLPHEIALDLLAKAAKGLLLILPKYKKIACVNLEIAFPGSSNEFKERTISETCVFIARLLMDFNRLNRLDEDWVKRNVVFENERLKNKLLDQQKRGAILFASGHLGSFEVLAHGLLMSGFPLRFIARNFKNKILDNWWNGRRELKGNKVIDRDGAYKKGLRTLSKGKNLGILFDQNVTQNHAAFVDFFSKKAATTKIVGILALRTKCTVAVTSIKYHDGKYIIKLTECDYSKYYDTEDISFDEKVEIITQDISKKYEAMIVDNPGEWFWMHRRWKTRPPGDKEKIYK